MKKFVSLLLVFVLLFSFSACQVLENASIYATQIKSFFGQGTDWDNEPALELTEIGGKTKYYFNTLTNREKHAYNNILEQIEGMPERIEIPMLDSESLTTVYESLLFDNPMLIHLGRSCNIISVGNNAFFTTEYTLTPEDYNKNIIEIEAAADSIVNNMPKNLSEFERELYIHDTIIEGCSYKNEGSLEESTVYGALVSGYSACEGYSKAAKLLLDMCGIESFVIAGKSKNPSGDYEGHMWNIVNIEGDYYNLDLTWDDPVSQKRIERPRHTFFNLSDEEISKTHSSFEKLYPCDSTEQNYFVKEGLYFAQYSDEVRSKLSQLISERVESNFQNIEVRFSTQEVYNSAIGGLFEQEHIYRILSVADISTVAKINTSKISYIQNDDFCVIDIFLIYE